MIVCLDDHAAGRLAAQHLLDCRLTSFAYYGNSAARHSVNREAGFADELRRHAYSSASAPVQYPGQFNDRSHWPLLVEWLRRIDKPVGILAVEDAAAFDLAAACRHVNLAVPEQVAIVGVNNDDLLCDSALPPLSSIDAGYTRVGYAAAQLLHRAIRGETIAARERHVRISPLKVIRRRSTDILAVDQPEVREALRFIREHACDPCGVVDVAYHVAKGRRWLERQFVKSIGRTPGEEIVRVQTQTAKRLLCQHSIPLPEIAARCGFASASTFGRAFQRAEGSTPAKFRRNAVRLCE